jgi:hypothetical protein
MKYNKVPIMHHAFAPRPPLEELLQTLAALSADAGCSIDHGCLACRRQLQVIICDIQQSPALWRPPILPDPVYSDSLAEIYDRIREIPLVGSMDWLNAQLQVAFVTHQAIAQSLSTPD